MLILHENVFVPVVLSLHLYPLESVAVTVCSPAFVWLYPDNVYPVPLVALVNCCAEPVYVLATHKLFVGIVAEFVIVAVYVLLVALLQLAVSVGVYFTVIVDDVPAFPTPLYVIVWAIPLAALLILAPLVIVILSVVPLVDAKVPKQLFIVVGVALNVFVELYGTLPLVSLNEILGVYFPILQLNVFVPVVLSLHIIQQIHLRQPQQQ